MKLKKHSASVLLLSFFIMTLLILVGLAVSFMVLGDLNALRSLRSGVQTRYSTEAMLEYGLLSVALHLPGYELEFPDYTYSSQIEAELLIHAREESIPCSPVSEIEPWRALDPGESFQMPLFYELADGSLQAVSEFYVEFYIGNEEGNGVYIPGEVLRWRILGETPSGNSEAISAFIGLLSASAVTPETATQFGTSVAATYSEYTSASYYSTESYTYYPEQTIQGFLLTHDKNVLFLSNLIQEEEAIIFFRIHSTDPNVPLPCDYLTLTAQSLSTFGDTFHEGEIIVEEGRNFPVFDFAVYHTGGPDFSPFDPSTGPLELDIESPF